MKKNTLYSVSLILGLLCFFFVKSKISSQPELYSHYYKYSSLTKSSTSPVNSSCFNNLIEEDDDHTFSLQAIIPVTHTLPFTLNSTLKVNLTKINNDVAHLYLGIPTFIVIQNFRL